MEVEEMVAAEAERPAEGPQGAASYVLSKLQAELEAPSPSDLLPRVREVLDAVRQSLALLHALRSALELPAAAGMQECADAAAHSHAAATRLAQQARELCELLQVPSAEGLVPAVHQLLDRVARP
eukprot:Transcript_23927.p3 GENE.Transcript_23927~~Transcript_23927.p3  ORF type:complete len:125 (+),score=41.35 Transcript_23927:83-457(+)